MDDYSIEDFISDSDLGDDLSREQMTYIRDNKENPAMKKLLEDAYSNFKKLITGIRELEKKHRRSIRDPKAHDETKPFAEAVDEFIQQIEEMAQAGIDEEAAGASSKMAGGRRKRRRTKRTKRTRRTRRTKRAKKARTAKKNRRAKKTRRAKRKSRRR